MLTGDEYQFKVYETVAQSPRLPLYQSNVVGPQSPQLIVFPSLVLMSGWDITAESRAGTARNILWSIRSVS